MSEECGRLASLEDSQMDSHQDLERHWQIVITCSDLYRKQQRASTLEEGTRLRSYVKAGARGIALE